MSGIKSSKSFTLSDRNFTFLRLDSTYPTDSSMDADARTYIARVLADGGTIVDANEIDAAIKLAKSQGWYSNCQLWFGGFGGYKNSGSGVAKWYNLAGSQTTPLDASQSSDTYRPIFTSSVSYQNDKPGLRFDATGTDNGRYLSITGAEGVFPTEGSLFTTHYADGDDLYAVFGTISNDQWWRVGSGSQFPGVWRTSRVGGAGSASILTGNQYTTTISNSSGWKQYMNGVLNIDTTADYNAGNDYRISDTTGRNDRALRGFIMEVIALSISASSTIQDNIESRFVTRYSLA